MTLNDRERLLAYWYVTTQSVILASALSGAVVDKELFAHANEEMDKYRQSNCPRISFRDARDLYTDISKFNKDFGKILDFKGEKSKTFGV